jgi:hypothetical protein
MMARSVRRNGTVVWGDGSLKEKPIREREEKWQEEKRRID